MQIIVDAHTNAESLVGGTFTDEHGDKFTILTADQAPALNSVAYGARGDAAGRLNGCLFVAILPYGKTLNVH
jgi:hypothetical protein